MPYIVANRDGILEQRTGRKWAKGQVIARHPFPEHVWQALLDEGAVVEKVEPAPPVKPKTTTKPKAKSNTEKVTDDNEA